MSIFQLPEIGGAAPRWAEGPPHRFATQAGLSPAATQASTPRPAERNRKIPPRLSLNVANRCSYQLLTGLFSVSIANNSTASLPTPSTRASGYAGVFVKEISRRIT